MDQTDVQYSGDKRREFRLDDMVAAFFLRRLPTFRLAQVPWMEVTKLK